MLSEYRRMERQETNAALGRICKKAVVHDPGVCLEGQKKTTKKMSRKSPWSKLQGLQDVQDSQLPLATRTRKFACSTAVSVGQLSGIQKGTTTGVPKTMDLVASDRTKFTCSAQKKSLTLFLLNLLFLKSAY